MFFWSPGGLKRKEPFSGASGSAADRAAAQTSQAQAANDRRIGALLPPMRRGAKLEGDLADVDLGRRGGLVGIPPRLRLGFALAPLLRRRLRAGRFGRRLLGGRGGLARLGRRAALGAGAAPPRLLFPRRRGRLRLVLHL